MKAVHSMIAAVGLAFALPVPADETDIDRRMAWRGGGANRPIT